MGSQDIEKLNEIFVMFAEGLEKGIINTDDIKSCSALKMLKQAGVIKKIKQYVTVWRTNNTL